MLGEDSLPEKGDKIAEELDAAARDAWRDLSAADDQASDIKKLLAYVHGNDTERPLSTSLAFKLYAEVRRNVSELVNDFRQEQLEAALTRHQLVDQVDTSQLNSDNFIEKTFAPALLAYFERRFALPTEVEANVEQAEDSSAIKSFLLATGLVDVEADHLISELRQAPLPRPVGAENEDLPAKFALLLSRMVAEEHSYRDDARNSFRGIVTLSSCFCALSLQPELTFRQTPAARRDAKGVHPAAGWSRWWRSSVVEELSAVQPPAAGWFMLRESVGKDASC